MIDLKEHLKKLDPSTTFYLRVHAMIAACNLLHQPWVIACAYDVGED